MKTNASVKGTMVTETYEGGKAVKLNPKDELLRTMATCLMFENTFYDSGLDIAKRIEDLAAKTDILSVGDIARYCKSEMKLRHAPLFLALQMLKHPQKSKVVPTYAIADTIANVIRRPDELAEMLAMYWKNGKTPIASQLKKGLAKAFTKFNEYQLGKWNQMDKAIKLRDVLFLCHAKPKDGEQAGLWKKLVDNTLAVPDTWEVSLSAGKDKKETWERLLREKKLPYMAMLMNIRNMVSVGVDRKLIADGLMAGAEKSHALPYRFVQAAKHAPGMASEISDAMVKAVKGYLPGHTAVVVDVSGSMQYSLSFKGTAVREDAATALAVLLREICEKCSVFSFSNKIAPVANYRGLALRDAINNSQDNDVTYLAKSLRELKAKHSLAGFDRIVVITDEQSQDAIIPCWAKSGYIINVAPYKPSLSLAGGWNRIDGWSERVVDWISFEEFGKLIVEHENLED